MGERYASWWLTGWGTIAVAGACLGLIAPSAPGIVAAFMLGVIAAGLASLVHQQQSAAGSPPTSGVLLGRVVMVHAGAGGVATIAVTAIAGVSGAVAGLLVVLAVATSPWAIGRLRRAAGAPAPPATDTTSPDPEDLRQDQVPVISPTEVGDLTDRELRRVWRQSFFDLQDASTTYARQRVVTLRHAYLDELERRDPEGVGSWLATEPRAASGPDRYLSPPPGEGHRDAS